MKKIAILHRFPLEQISETNASIRYLLRPGVDVLTFKTFNRMSPLKKMLKSLLWCFYAPLLVIGRGYDVIYCDDSFPFYPILVQIACPFTKIVLRLGDLHLMYYCSGWLYNLLHAIELIGWRWANEILAISVSMREYIIAEIHDKQKVYTVLDPIDLEDFSVPRTPAEKPTVMFHGTLTENKGLNRLLMASSQLPLVRFVIIGEGEARKKLERLASSNVEFMGWVPHKEIAKVLATAHIGLAMRSRNPGNEYVVTSPFLQYSALGIPCLVTRRQVFEDMGYPWQFNSTTELVTQIIRLIKEPQDNILTPWVRRRHDAKRIGAEIWSRLSS